MRKFRPAQGALNNLPASQRKELEAWMRNESVTYGQMRTRLLERFGVKTSCAALGTYYRRLHSLEGRTASGGNPASAISVGAEITIRIAHAGEIKLEIRPLADGPAARNKGPLGVNPRWMEKKRARRTNPPSRA